MVTHPEKKVCEKSEERENKPTHIDWHLVWCTPHYKSSCCKIISSFSPSPFSLFSLFFLLSLSFTCSLYVYQTLSFSPFYTHTLLHSLYVSVWFSLSLSFSPSLALHSLYLSLSIYLTNYLFPISLSLSFFLSLFLSLVYSFNPSVLCVPHSYSIFDMTSYKLGQCFAEE